MNKNNSNKKVSSPTLKTIRMVENALKNMDGSYIKVSQLKRILPKQVNHNILLDILDHLQDHNRILIGTRGIAYIYNPSKKFAEAIANSYDWEDLKKKYMISEILSKKT